MCNKSKGRPAGSLLALLLLLVQCAPQLVTKSTVSSVVAGKSESAVSADTTLYSIDFADNEARDLFVRDFEKFIKRYPFDRTTIDTVHHRAVIRLAPRSAESTAAGEIRPPFEENAIGAIESTVTEASYASRPDTQGSVVLYAPDGIENGMFTPLCRTFPGIGGDGACVDTTTLCPDNVPATPGYVSFNPVAANKIAVTISEGLVNGKGRRLSAFDLVQAWTGFIKQNPAEGSAIFRYVKGVQQFIAGREAVIGGFVVTDQRTVTLLLERPDSEAVTRLLTDRIVPLSLDLGPYLQRTDSPGRTGLAPNRNFLGGRAFLNECVLQTNEDKNPLLSFSLKKLDVVPLFAKKDLDYARSKMASTGVLTRARCDRYFLSINAASQPERLFLAAIMDPRQTFTNIIKAEGRVLGAIECDTPAAAAANPGAAEPPRSSVIVLFMANDPVASLIGQKLLADLTARGIACELKGLSGTEYETALLGRGWSIAIGYSPQSILTDAGERLRCATLWFADDTNEAGRIASGYEKPLFAIQWYFLHRNTIGFFENKMAGIHLNPIR